MQTGWLLNKTLQDTKRYSGLKGNFLEMQFQSLFPQGRCAHKLHTEQLEQFLVVLVWQISSERPAAQVHTAAELLDGHGSEVSSATSNIRILQYAQT